MQALIIIRGFLNIIDSCKCLIVSEILFSLFTSFVQHLLTKNNIRNDEVSHIILFICVTVAITEDSSIIIFQTVMNPFGMK